MNDKIFNISVTTAKKQGLSDKKYYFFK